MDFTPTDDRRMLAESLGRFLKAEYDADRRLKVAYDAPFHDPTAWGKLAEMGVPGMLVPESAGGYGGAGFDIATVFEELGRALCPEPLLGVAMAGAVLSADDPAAEAIVAGTTRPAFALWEDGGALETRAEGGKITGRKSVVYGGGAADLFFVSATDADGSALYAVEAADADVTAYPVIEGGGAAEVLFDGAPARKLGGADAIASAEQAGVLALCAEAAGIMDALVAITLDYLKTRRQFGTTIGSFQALQHRMVDMTTEAEMARSITIRAAASLGTDMAGRHGSMAKNLIGRAGKQIAEEAIQLHGGIAMTWEAPVSHYAKRLIMIDAQLGDRDQHLQKVMAG